MRETLDLNDSSPKRELSKSIFTLRMRPTDDSVQADGFGVPLYALQI